MNRLPIKISKAVIAEVGYDRLEKKFGVPRNTMFFWCCRGVPRSWACAIYFAYPNLLSWSDYKNEVEKYFSENSEEALKI